MTLKHLKALIFLSALSLSVFSCIKAPDFSLVPEISFNDISKDIRLDQYTGAKKDSIIVALNYSDGDGDMGWDASEIGSGKKVDSTNYNYLVKTFRKTNGIYKEFVLSPTLSGFYPRLKPDGKTGPIEGILYYRIELYSAFWPVKKDTLVFKIKIKDRANNTSNEVETKPIVVNQF